MEWISHCLFCKRDNDTLLSLWLGNDNVHYVCYGPAICLTGFFGRKF